MKKILGILILVVAAVFQAQASDQTPQQRHTREQFAKIQAEHIAHDLALDDKTAAPMPAGSVGCDWKSREKRGQF